MRPLRLELVVRLRSLGPVLDGSPMSRPDVGLLVDPEGAGSLVAAVRSLTDNLRQADQALPLAEWLERTKQDAHADGDVRLVGVFDALQTLVVQLRQPYEGVRR